MANVNDNLQRLIYSFKKCDFTDDQILSVLTGMGMLEDAIKTNMAYYNQFEEKDKVADNPAMTLNHDMECEQPSLGTTMDVCKGSLNDTFYVDKNKKTHKKNIKENMNNFTALQLYENLIQKNDVFRSMTSGDSNTSYSALTAMGICESAIAKFPQEIQIMSGRKSMGLPVDESKINPSIKYNIAESVYYELSDNWLSPAKELCAYIAETMRVDKWGYVGAKLMNATVKQAPSNSMYAKLYEDTMNVLSGTNIEEDLKNLARKEQFWSSECAQVVALAESEEYVDNNTLVKTVVENNNCKMVKCFSPIVTSNNGVTFNLWDKNYTLSNGKLMESQVSDSRYNDVVNGLHLMNYNEYSNNLEYYGANGKILEYCLNDGKLHVGNADMTQLGSLDLCESLTISGLFNDSNRQDIDTLVRFFENRDMLATLDNCVNLSPEYMNGIYLTLIAVDEGYYVNVVDYNTFVNEMKFFTTATKTRAFIKEQINYDATILLKEALQAEGDKKAEIESKRNEIKERIAFLKEQRNMVISKIENMPKNIDTSKLAEAMNLLECELRDQEDMLQKSFSADLDNSDYVPVKVCRVTGSLNPGDEVYVSASEFTAMPECSTITIINPRTNAKEIVNKEDLVFDINHNSDNYMPNCCGNNCCGNECCGNNCCGNDSRKSCCGDPAVAIVTDDNPDNIISADSDLIIDEPMQEDDDELYM